MIKVIGHSAVTEADQRIAPGPAQREPATLEEFRPLATAFESLSPDGDHDAQALALAEAQRRWLDASVERALDAWLSPYAGLYEGP